MLEVVNVKKVFNPKTPNEKIALQRVNVTINDGDFVTVIGGNGAGKSTLLNVVSGSAMPDGGRITLSTVDITRKAQYKRASYIGRVYQDPMMGTASEMTIEENMAMALRRGEKRTLRKGRRNEERVLYREMLARLDLGLETRLKEKVGLLSGGQRQALALLMATIKKPDLLLLDEHTAALDPKTALTVMRITDEIIRENALTTLMVTHNMKDALTYGNRLIMMHEGSVLLDIGEQEKRKMGIKDLLALFEQKSGEALNSDKMLLA